jgi:Winged helix DNA-binding domain
VSTVRISRGDVLRFRAGAQQLMEVDGRRDAAILDLGVQDTGPDGAGWALALRGCSARPDDLFLAWTLRGAPHAYRRAEAAGVAAAVAPWSEGDAAKRIFDAAKPLKAAGITILDALDHIAGEMRDIAATPTVKGTMSSALTERLDRPYLRACRPCNALHAHEQTFRLAALRAGLELEAGTSPPVLHRIPGWPGRASQVPPHLDVIRGVLRFLGPSTPKLVAGYIDTPVKEVAARWPVDVVSVELDGLPLDILAADLDALSGAGDVEGVRLLGPFDLFLQGRDRELIVPEPAARADLWRVLGRPGAVLVDHEVVGSWRPRSSGRSLKLAVTMWDGRHPPPALEEQAERLAAFRNQSFAGFLAG